MARRSTRELYRRVNSAAKGDRAKFKTSTQSPKTPYLVRLTLRSERFAPEWAWDLPDVDYYALLVGKRGGEYVVTAEREWPGPEHEAWLYRLTRNGLGDRTRLTGFSVLEAQEYKPDYLWDYLPPRMAEAWPDV
jgi:hypothetical protein